MNLLENILNTSCLLSQYLPKPEKNLKGHENSKFLQKVEELKYSGAEYVRKKKNIREIILTVSEADRSIKL